MTTDHIMFFDVETTGLPKNWKAPMAELDNWPRVIQLAWSICDRAGEECSWGKYLIYPDGWVIPDGSDGTDATFWIQHGFSTAASLAAGVPIADAANHFVGDMQSAAYLVSHNMDFDYKVMGAECLRLGLRGERIPTRICTKEASTAYCKIPHANRRDTRSWVKQNYKWPKLVELHQKLFGRPFDDAHDAGGDVAALKSCFFELVRLGVIKLEELPAPAQRAPQR